MTSGRTPRAFAFLLALFPRAFREVYGDDMRHVFIDQLNDARIRAGRVGVIRLWLRTIPRMAGAAWAERRTARQGSQRDRLPMFESLTADLRLARRSLTRSPLFTLVAVGALSLGIGSVTTIFSAMNAIVLRPLPGTANGNELVGIDRRTPDWSEGVSASNNFFRYIQSRSQSLNGVAVWSRAPLTIAHDGASVAVPGNIVSANYFSVLGVKPELGRFFPVESDATATSDASIVVSHRFWMSNLAGRQDAIGKTVVVNGRPYTLIGVAGEGFRGVFTPLRVDAWVPLSTQPHVRPTRDLADMPWFWIFGRLRPDVARAQARTELAALTAAWAVAGGSDPYLRYTDIRLVPLTGLPDDARQAILGFGGMLLGAAALVLLIASANVSSLLAARASVRQREMSLRTALGAGRVRLVRQLLTETLSVFALGAIGGLLVAGAATSALERLPLPGDTALILELSPDVRVGVFALLVSLIAGVAFGLGPAVRGTGLRSGGLLNDASRGSSGRRSRLTRTLIVGQLAGSLVLLAVAGVFMRALSHGASINPRFDVSNVETSRFTTEAYGYDTASASRFYVDLRRRLEQSPGVASVSFGDFTPLSATPSNGRVTVDGRRVGIKFGTADARYFETLRIPIIAGREFTNSDTADGPHVAVVNEAFAKAAWTDRAAVGREFMRDDTRITIIGVARNIKHTSLDGSDEPFVYYPMAQQWQSNQTLFVRGAGPAPQTEDAIRAAVKAIDAQVPVPAVTTLAEETSYAVFPQRVAAIVTGVLGAGGLLLACAGLYGVMAFAVSLRTREIGVRMALGARPADVLRMVVIDGLRLAGIGVVIGLAGAIAAMRVTSAYLLGASAIDLPTFVTVTMVLLAMSCVASYLPARRAASTDPLNTLRAE
jgi:predicted permease